MGVYAKQIINVDADITESEGVVEVSKGLVNKIAAFTSKRRDDSCTAPPGPVPVLTFRVYLIHFLGNMYKIATLLE